MKSAKDLFEELGFELAHDDICEIRGRDFGSIEYRKYEDDEQGTGDRHYVSVSFNAYHRWYTVYEHYGWAELVTLEAEDTWADVDMDLLKAIFQQCYELGWIEL